MNAFCYVDSPIGRLLLTSDGAALTGLYMNLYRNKPTKLPELNGDWLQNAAVDPLPAAGPTAEGIFFRAAARIRPAAAHGRYRISAARPGASCARSLSAKPAATVSSPSASTIRMGQERSVSRMGATPSPSSFPATG